jgi:hypothetical protein
LAAKIAYSIEQQYRTNLPDGKSGAFNRPESKGSRRTLSSLSVQVFANSRNGFFGLPFRSNMIAFGSKNIGNIENFLLFDQTRIPRL